MAFVMAMNFLELTMEIYIQGNTELCMCLLQGNIPSKPILINNYVLELTGHCLNSNFLITFS